MRQNIERDDFGDNLGLGFDDGNIRGSWINLSEYILSDVAEVIYVEFGEPDVTNQEDMKSGEW